MKLIPTLERLRDACLGLGVRDAAAEGQPGAEADLGDLEVAGAEAAVTHREALASPAMRSRRLGREGPEVSVVGLGCNNFGMRVDLEGTRAVVDAALDAGVTLFDTADIYGDKGGSESFLGEALEGRRDGVVLATKFGGDMGDGTEARGSRAYIHKAIDASLQRLRTDVDRPLPVPHARQRHAVRGDVRRARRARACGEGALRRPLEPRRRAGRGGRRDLPRARLCAAGQRAERVLAAAARSRGGAAADLRAARDRRAAVLPAGERSAHRQVPPRRAAPRRDAPGRTGTTVFTDETFDRLEALEEFAKERGLTLLQVAIGGLLARPAIASVIAGATKPEQVRANVEAAGWEPTAEDVAALDSLSYAGSRSMVVAPRPLRLVAEQLVRLLGSRAACRSRPRSAGTAPTGTLRPSTRGSGGS